MELKGKQLSLGSKLAAVVFVLLCFMVTLVTGIEIPVNDTIKIGLFMALIFAPVDISLWFETLSACFGIARRRKRMPAEISDRQTAEAAEITAKEV